MKKWMILLLAAALCFGAAACGSNTEPAAQEETAEAAEPAEEAEPAEPAEETVEEAETEEVTVPEDNTIYSFGDTVTVDDMFEFTPVFEGFAEEVANWPDENYLTPEGQMSGSNPYKADDEKVMMYFSGTIEYTGDEKENVSFIYSYSVDYDDGYIFNGNPSDSGITADETWVSYENVIQMNGEGNNKAVFEPLSSKTTRYIRFCIEVPEVLETDEESPCYVIFTLNGANYTFSLR